MLQCWHILLFTLLLASPKWRQTAFILLVSAAVYTLANPEIGKALDGGLITYESYLIYALVDVVAGALILCPASFKSSSPIHKGALHMASIIWVAVLIHLITCVEFLLWQSGYLQTKVLGGVYFTVSDILNSAQLLVGAYGIPSAIRNIMRFASHLVAPGRLAYIHNGARAAMAKFEETNTGLAR